MPKSRLRGGAKAHRMRVQKRRELISETQTKMQKMWQQEMMKKIEEMNASKNSVEEVVEEVTQETDDSGIEIPLEIRL